MRRFLILFLACGFPCLLHAEAPKPLASYPLSGRVWLGAFGGEVEVNPLTELVAGRAGEIEWKAQEGAEVREGEAVAFSAARQIRQSAGQLELDQAALPLKLKTSKWAAREKAAGLNRQMEELEARIGKLALTPKERGLLGEDLTRRLAEEGRKLEGERENLREKLDPDFLAEELRIEQEQLRQDLERAASEHADLVQSMEVPAPSDGILHILKTGMVRAGDVIGTIERRGKASVVLQLLDPEIRSETPETLAIAVSSPTGEMLPGTFSRVERIAGSRLGPAIYHFTLDANPDAPLKSELSGERMITLYKLLGRQARIVPKAEFLFSHPAEIQRQGWAGFLRGVWPDGRIVHIGPRSIALTGQE